jgi:hypothetical protein
MPSLSLEKRALKGKVVGLVFFCCSYFWKSFKMPYKIDSRGTTCLKDVANFLFK